jgi:hypothetical protein
MISLDSSVILIALDKRDDLHKRAAVALESSEANGFCICGPVCAELRAANHWTIIHEFLETSGIVVDWKMPQSVWNQAGIFSRPTLTNVKTADYQGASWQISLSLPTPSITSSMS